MKKTYIIPSLEVVNLQSANIICTSINSNAAITHGGSSDSYVGPEGGRSAEYGGGLWDDTEE
ncbi:MAG: hypothetical protein J6X27_07430 [Bacteroidaceae bacterium]|nr:hypothetical protein [Bacteroidaceae bacterium]